MPGWWSAATVNPGVCLALLQGSCSRKGSFFPFNRKGVGIIDVAVYLNDFGH